jgi:sulfotransferase
MKQHYFISGLPRSGSTLLSAILKQNPEFYADISSPVQSLCSSVIDVLTASENNLNIKEDQRTTLLHHVFEGYYAHVNRSVIFDSNRGWTSRTSLLKHLFPYTKIICCVREIEWILDSFERITAQNCLYTNTFADDESHQSVETRCVDMMDVKKSGMVIKPWYWLQEGLAINPDMILLIDYKDLCQNPKRTIEGVYRFIGKDYYNHDFNNVKYENEVFDMSINKRDLHTVKRKVEWVDRRSILPKYVSDRYTNMSFWKSTTQSLNYG